MVGPAHWQDGYSNSLRRQDDYRLTRFDSLDMLWAGLGVWASEMDIVSTRSNEGIPEDRRVNGS